jgi:hypothetical protein
MVRLKDVKNDFSPIAQINTTHWAPNNNIVGCNPIINLNDCPPWWPTRTLAGDGLWYRWGENDSKIAIRPGEAKFLYENAHPANALGSDHVFGSTIPLVVGSKKVPEIMSAKIRNKWTSIATAGNGRYLVLFASDGALKWVSDKGFKVDDGLTTFEASSLLLASRNIDGKPVQADYAILLDSGHSTQIYAPDFLFAEDYPVLASFAVMPNP